MNPFQFILLSVTKVILLKGKPTHIITVIKILQQFSTIMTKPQSLTGLQDRVSKSLLTSDGASVLPAETPHTTCSRHHAGHQLWPPGFQVQSFYQLSCPHISLLSQLLLTLQTQHFSEHFLMVRFATSPCS